MTDDMRRFRVTNTTVKKPKYNKEGKDVRTVTEKVGHAVQWRDEKDALIQLYPSRSKIVDKILPSIQSLADGMYVKIELIDSIGKVLAEHTQRESEARSKARTEAKKKRKKSKKAKAVEMGKDGHGQGSGTEHEGATNPDGDPNFLVKAPRGGKKKKKSRGRPPKEE